MLSHLLTSSAYHCIQIAPLTCFPASTNTNCWVWLSQVWEWTSTEKGELGPDKAQEQAITEAGRHSKDGKNPDRTWNTDAIIKPLNNYRAFQSELLLCEITKSFYVFKPQLIIMSLAVKSILTLFLDWWFVLHSKLMLLPKEDIIHEENNLKYTAYLFYWSNLKPFSCYSKV